MDLLAIAALGLTVGCESSSSDVEGPSGPGSGSTTIEATDTAELGCIHTDTEPDYCYRAIPLPGVKGATVMIPIDLGPERGPGAVIFHTGDGFDVPQRIWATATLELTDDGLRLDPSGIQIGDYGVEWAEVRAVGSSDDSAEELLAQHRPEETNERTVLRMVLEVDRWVTADLTPVELFDDSAFADHLIFAREPDGSPIPIVAETGQGFRRLLHGSAAWTLDPTVLARPVGWPEIETVNQTVFGDVDGDGYEDVLLTINEFAEEDGMRRLGLLLRRPSTAFGFELVDLGALNAGLVGLGDLDGDGTIDVVSNPWLTRDYHLYRGRGDGSFESPVVGAPRIPGVGSYRVGDFDGDGIAEMLVTRSEGSMSEVGTLDGIGSEARYRAMIVPGGQIRAVADLDRDGRLDMVTETYTDDGYRSTLWLSSPQ